MYTKKQNELINAIRNNDVKEVDILITNYEGADPSFHLNYCIGFASEIGHLDIVNVLMKDRRVDPSDSFNYSIKYACEKGHVDVVKLLLTDKRVNPASDDYAIQMAFINKHEDVIDVLWQYKKLFNL